MLRKLIVFAVVVWSFTPLTQARLLYESNTIALYSVDAEAGATNQHPVDVNPERLEALLSRVEVQSEKTNNTATPLFPDNKALAAAKEIHTALRHLPPNQELMLIGYRSEGNFFNSKRYSTSARVFVQDGQLNMILGQVDQFHAEFRDHDKGLPPIGSRNSQVALDGSIPPTTGVEQFDNRQDWLVLDLGLDVPPKQDRRVGYDRAGVTQTASVSATPPAAPQPAPVQEKTAYQQDQAAPAPQPISNLDPELQRVEQEFELLQRLRTKGLITDQDYEQKKKQLLERL